MGLLDVVDNASLPLIRPLGVNTALVGWSPANDTEFRRLSSALGMSVVAVVPAVESGGVAASAEDLRIAGGGY